MIKDMLISRWVVVVSGIALGVSGSSRSQGRLRP